MYVSFCKQTVCGRVTISWIVSSYKTISFPPHTPWVSISVYCLGAPQVFGCSATLYRWSSILSRQSNSLWSCFCFAVISRLISPLLWRTKWVRLVLGSFKLQLFIINLEIIMHDIFLQPGMLIIVLEYHTYHCIWYVGRPFVLFVAVPVIHCKSKFKSIWMLKPYNLFLRQYLRHVWQIWIPGPRRILPHWQYFSLLVIFLYRTLVLVCVWSWQCVHLCIFRYLMIQCLI